MFKKYWFFLISLTIFSNQAGIVSARSLFNEKTQQEVVILGEHHGDNATTRAICDQQLAAIERYCRQHPDFDIGYESSTICFECLPFEQRISEIDPEEAPFYIMEHIEFKKNDSLDAFYYGYFIDSINIELSTKLPSMQKLDHHRLCMVNSLSLLVRDDLLRSYLLETVMFGLIGLSSEEKEREVQLLQSYLNKLSTLFKQKLFEVVLNSTLALHAQLQNITKARSHKYYRFCLTSLEQLIAICQRQDLFALRTFLFHKNDNSQETVQECLKLYICDIIALDFIFNTERSLIIVGGAHAEGVAEFLQNNDFVQHYKTQIVEWDKDGVCNLFTKKELSFLIARYCLSSIDIDDPEKIVLFQQFLEFYALSKSSLFPVPFWLNYSTDLAFKEALHELDSQMSQLIGFIQDVRLLIDLEHFFNYPDSCEQAQIEFFEKSLTQLLPLDNEKILLVERALNNMETLLAIGGLSSWPNKMRAQMTEYIVRQMAKKKCTIQ